MAAEKVDIPLIIGGKEIRTGDTAHVGDAARSPARARRLAQGDRRSTSQQAIDAAAEARAEWANWAWEDRAAVFLKAAELLTTTWRDTLNAATMLGQSKTVFQAEIDAAVRADRLLALQRALRAGAATPSSRSATTRCGISSTTAALEGFVYAVTPFNFTSIGGNLPTAPALMGNTVIWKPASSAMLSAYYLMKLLEAAGLPPGVINFVPGDAAMISNVLLSHRDLAGVHFTGSTAVFNNMWKTIGANMSQLPLVSAHRRRDGRQGLHRRASVGRSSTRSPSRSRAAASSTRDRSARRRAASTCRESLWTDVRDRAVAMIDDIKMGDIRPTSATSWAR